MAEWIEPLLHKHEIMSSDPCENLDTVVHIFNSKTGSTEMGGSLELTDKLV